jgi:ubiquinone/menaquinone biosynthesis C-methylase UbiE
MTSQPADHTNRFTRRVPYYHRSRPRYPQALIALLADELGLRSSHIIADVGAGTGISSELFLANGHQVYAVEPNAAMLDEARRHYGHMPGFHPVHAPAEATSLPEASVDFVVAGQAFHWFNKPAARQEFDRILRPGGRCVLFWNMRPHAENALQDAYNALMAAFDVEGLGEFRQTAGSRDEEELLAFFGGHFEERSLPNQQVLDYEGFVARVLSASYMPLPGEPRHDALMSQVNALFAQHNVNGSITLSYRTDVYWA